MIVRFRTRFRVPVKRILIFLILSAASTTFYLSRNPHIFNSRRMDVTLMSITPVIPELAPRPPAAPPIVNRNVQVQKNETFSQVMQQQGFDNQTIQDIYEKARAAYDLGQIRAGKTIELTLAPDGTLWKLQYSVDPTQTLIVENRDGEISATMQRFHLETRVIELGGIIKGSLYSAMNHLGESDELVMRFVDIFEYDVDFIKDLQEGDSFRIVYEKKFVRNEPFDYGKILAAELINKGKVYTAVGFQTDQAWEFFSPDGKAMKKAFLASPLKFSRISSGFTTRRYHPILHDYRAHLGIDYVAPLGTPVRSIGKGRVLLAGWSGGGGKSIKIEHSKEIATVYCHLSRFVPGIRKGSSVEQGQVIGYVGSTGMSTGPHLDFRYLKNGRYINFLSLKSPQADPLTAPELARFQHSLPEIEQRLIQVELHDPPAEYGYIPSTPVRFSEQTY